MRRKRLFYPLLNDFGALFTKAPKSLMIINPILCGLLYKMCMQY